MNKENCPELSDAVSEITEIAIQTQTLIPSANISAWDKLNWVVALVLAIGGLAAAPFSSGISLVATALGIIWLLIDMVKKISETARDNDAKTHAEKLHERLEFLAWCLGA